VRDLIVMAGSFSHLRHSESAVSAYLRDHLESGGDDVADVPHLDLWGLTEAEIHRTLAFVHGVLERTTDGGGTRTPHSLSAGEIVAMGGEALGEVAGQQEADLPQVRVEPASTEQLLQELTTLRSAVPDPDRHARLDRGSTRSGVTGLSLEVPAAAPDADSLNASESAGVLTAYLLAFHLGGSMQLSRETEGAVYRLVLPEDQDNAVVDAPQPGWLDMLLMRLESWD
jgi:hypothetical protein